MIAMASLWSTAFSSIPTLSNSVRFTSFAPSISFCILLPCRLPQPSYIVRCLKANVDTTFVESLAGIDASFTETKKAAADVGRGSDLVAFYSDHYEVPVNVEKEASLDKCHATRLLLEGDRFLEDIFVDFPAPLAVSEELCLVYEERYMKMLLNGEWSANELPPAGFPWSHELLTRSCASAGGAVAAMHVVMLGLRLVAASISGYGCSSHVEGFPLVPSGVFNDVAIAASVALQSYPNFCNARKPILVVDLDVHQRTDTRRLFENDNRVVTFNLHGSNNAPWCTDMRAKSDSGLLDCTGDDYYLAVLSDRLQHLFDFCNPGLVFFQAGVDALAEDLSGKLSMTRQGLIHRNNIVYTACFTRKIPLVITMGSGCSKPVDASIEAHADVYRAAALRNVLGGKCGWQLMHWWEESFWNGCTLVKALRYMPGVSCVQSAIMCSWKDGKKFCPCRSLLQDCFLPPDALLLLSIHYFFVFLKVSLLAPQD
ncbi:hypothetical protein GOP47_0015398 [Adiantum capillus-veneris]|uniref:Histone deacetylase domain-containing protein n=1 Tax=Adiantum capillus-veneris TaxID=13818 RepID=A0A9D4ZCL8_ADICA|nr:hypothetical protein GOP47_0015398 [Adiantum capillus-veneris]